MIVGNETLKSEMKNNVTIDAAGCWRWMGSISSQGYGWVKIGRRRVGAHRVSFQVFVGRIPHGLVIDHLCRVHDCINPEHLRACTNRENILAGTGRGAKNALKTHCKMGHLLEGANVAYLEKLGRDKPYRQCRVCSTAWSRKRYAKLKAGNATGALLAPKQRQLIEAEYIKNKCIF